MFICLFVVFAYPNPLRIQDKMTGLETHHRCCMIHISSGLCRTHRQVENISAMPLWYIPDKVKQRKPASFLWFPCWQSEKKNTKKTLKQIIKSSWKTDHNAMRIMMRNHLMHDIVIISYRPVYIYIQCVLYSLKEIQINKRCSNLSEYRPVSTPSSSHIRRDRMGLLSRDSIDDDSSTVPADATLHT